jgi:hypothetical protein
MILRLQPLALLYTVSLPLTPALASQTAPLPPAGPHDITVVADRPASADELVLPPDHIIEVKIDGMPLRLLVTADASGPLAVNPAIAVNRNWRATGGILWDYGDGKGLRSGFMWKHVDFKDRSALRRVMWSFGRPTPLADGLIGIQELPFKRIVMPLSAPVGEQTVQRFPLRRFGGNSARIGTEIDADGRKLKAVFATDQAKNFITAPTANFIATRFDGAFVPGSDGTLRMRFGVERRTRTMRLTRPLELGDLLIDSFAVRLEDYGTARHVGEASEDDPRFNPEEIVVSQRKPRGRADLLTRIGRDTIAHCSRLTYDFEKDEIELTCGRLPG